MDKVLKYQKILKDVLQAYAIDDTSKTHKPDDMQIRLIFDTESNHYQVLYTGWRQYQQTFSVLFHFDIIDEKIWVQRNISDYDIVGDIENAGVPKSDIILAFYAPEMRPFTEYAFV
jgi:hypothetical protein